MVPLTDDQALTQAYRQAQIRQGFTAPNPAVGAVLVKRGQVIARGYHDAPGAAHAEVMAINVCHDPAGATLYVTLEPCCHHGRTPPCTEAIIAAGIKRVVYAYADPNPCVAGKGARTLRAAGIACELMPRADIDLFYRAYAYWWRHQRPYAVAKIALSADGAIAGEGGEPVTMTDAACARYTHQQRCQSDALFTTVKTILHDDPQLNVRLLDEVFAKPLFILDRDATLPLTAKIWQTASSVSVLHAVDADPQRLANLREQGARCLPIDADGKAMLWFDVMRAIGQQGVHRLWVECGGQAFIGLHLAGMLAEACVMIAPIDLGASATRVTLPSLQQRHYKKSLKVSQQWQRCGQSQLLLMHYE